MARTFSVPAFYRSPVVGRVKAARTAADPRKRDLAPTVLDLGPLRVWLARHFGFCFGVENAIEIAYRTLDEHPEQAAAGRVFLLSEMIHNPHVNADLTARGIRFLRTTSGEELVPLATLGPGDIVLIPAFGTTPAIEAALAARGVETQPYDTTCPFVVRVWKKSAQIGQADHTVVVHGKRTHEETRATFARAAEHAPVVVVRDAAHAETLAAVIEGRAGADVFWQHFAGATSDGFDPARDLARIGVVNQTTMLATETAAIAERLRQAVITRDGHDANVADTADTLCYATKENQDATTALIDGVQAAAAPGRAVALVVGGHNSSNTSHLVELCEDAGLPTYFVEGPDALVSPDEIHDYDWRTKTARVTRGWLASPSPSGVPPVGDGAPVDLLLTAGASCPDALLDAVLRKVAAWVPGAADVEAAVAALER